MIGRDNQPKKSEGKMGSKQIQAHKKRNISPIKDDED